MDAPDHLAPPRPLALAAGSGFRFEDRGMLVLKSMPEERRLFPVAA